MSEVYYTLVPSGHQWRANILEPESPTIFEMADDGVPFQAESKVSMIQVLREAYPGKLLCHVSRSLLEKMRMERAGL